MICDQSPERWCGEVSSPNDERGRGVGINQNNVLINIIIHNT